jgi:methyl-accepting chemotaxis protein
MAQTLMDRFLIRYADAEPLDRKQTSALVYTLVSIAAAAGVAAVMIQNSGMRLVLSGLVLLLFGILVLVRVGQAVIASVATTILLSLLFAAIPFLQPYEAAYEIYLIATLECFALITTGLVARRRWQAIAVMIVALTAVMLDYFTRIVPNTAEENKNLDDVVITVIILIVATAIERAIRNRDYSLLAISRTEAAKSKAHIDRLERLIRSSGDTLGLGIAARKSAESTAGLVAGMSATLDGVDAGFSELEASAAAILESYKHIVDSARLVETKVADQSAVITESSAAIEQMTSAVNSISAIAAARRAAVGKLKSATDDGSSQMSDLADALRAMESAAASIVEVVEVIRAVASQTNLLAMNAAIEAAHAGDAGKGFSVVADEIRKLSEETNENVRIIDADIGRTVEAMKAAAAVNESAQDIFKKVDEEADAVAGAMDEIGRGLSEISAGSGEILQGTSESVQITTTVRDASRLMGEAIHANETDLGLMSDRLEAVRLSLGSVVEGFQKVRAESDSLGEAGRLNELALTNLMESLEASR